MTCTDAAQRRAIGRLRLTCADRFGECCDVADAGAAYAEIQERMSGLVGSLTPAQLAARVPACPQWSVQDLLAHHVGVVSELASGSLTEIGDAARLLDQNSDPAVARDRDTMTARHVAERRGRPVDAILAEWAAATHTITPMLQGTRPFPDRVGMMGGAIAVNDAVVHEGDLHEALGVAPPPEVLATSLALAGYGFSLGYRIGRAGLPAVAFAYDGKQRVVGDGAPAAVVQADRTTLVRMLASRLTPTQIRALDWRGDPTPYLDVLGEYGPA